MFFLITAVLPTQLVFQGNLHIGLSENYRKPGFPGGTVVKNSPASAGDVGWISGSGRSPGEGNDNPLQSSYLESPMDRGASWATVHGVAKSNMTEHACTH